MYVYNLININLLFQLSELIHWKSGGSPADWGLVIFFPFSPFRTIRSPTEVRRFSASRWLHRTFTGLGPDRQRNLVKSDGIHWKSDGLSAGSVGIGRVRWKSVGIRRKRGGSVKYTPICNLVVCKSCTRTVFLTWQQVAIFKEPPISLNGSLTCPRCKMVHSPFEWHPTCGIHRWKLMQLYSCVLWKRLAHRLAGRSLSIWVSYRNECVCGMMLLSCFLPLMLCLHRFFFFCLGFPCCS